MYTRPEPRRRDNRQDVFIPENYSGTAFNERNHDITSDAHEIDAEITEPTDTEIEEVCATPKKKNGLFDGLSGEDLLLLGVILLLSQEEEGNDILPILLLLLFFRR